MRELLSWNIYLCRCAGLQVRLHAFFLIVVALVLLDFTSANPRGPLWAALVGLGLLAFSVTLHEAAHCFVARRLGGRADLILLWPLGGLGPMHVPLQPAHELAVALAGPLANVLVCLMLLPMLLLGGSSLASLVHPLRPPQVGQQFGWLACAGLAFWLNWVLVLVNLLPATPLDGGRIFRALLWHSVGYRTASIRIGQLARLSACVLAVAAWLVHDDFPAASAPLLLLGMLLFFSARGEAERLHDSDPDDQVFGYDFSQGYTSLGQGSTAVGAPAGLIRQWIANRKARRRQTEEDEERRMDEVLAKLHLEGMAGLSEYERALLKRVSSRFRNRQRG